MNYMNAGAKDLKDKLNNALLERLEFEEKHLKSKAKNEELLEELVNLKIKLSQHETKIAF